MADDGGRLACGEHRPDELHGRGDRPQLIGVGYAAGQYQRVVVCGIGVTDGPVHGEEVCLVQVVERLGLARFGREEFGGPPGVLDRLPWLGELDLLHALVGGQERYPAAVKLIRHE